MNKRELMAMIAALETEYSALLAGGAAAGDPVAHLAAVDAKATDWNRRNTAFTAEAQAVNRDREDWVADCGNRRYREEDELAIRRGQ